MTELLYGFALILAIEGIAYAAFPDAMRRMVARILSEPTARVRQFGLISGAAGVGLVWLLRSL